GETFRFPESHSQLVYDVNDIAPAAAIWTSVQFRPPGAAIPQNLFTTNMTVALSVSALPPAGMSGVFASNLGAQVFTMFTGPLSLPNRPIPTWPAPWEAPVPFTVPFLYVPIGKSFVVDIVQTGALSNAIWFLEAWVPDLGYGVQT